MLIVLMVVLSVPASVLAEKKAGAVQTVSSAVISDTEVKIGKQMTWQLSVSGAPSKVVWSTSNKKIATVSSEGLVKAKKKIGKAVITATLEDGTKLNCTVKVVKPSISQKEVSVVAAFSTQLSVLNTTKSVKWKSSNTNIAKVSSSGKVTGRSKGSCTITATVDGYTLKCKVTVKANMYKFEKPRVHHVSRYNWDVLPHKVYYEGGKVCVDAYVVNNLNFGWTIYCVDYIDMEIYDWDTLETIAFKSFGKRNIRVKDGYTKKITLKFSGSATKIKDYDFRDGNFGISTDAYAHYWY